MNKRTRLFPLIFFVMFWVGTSCLAEAADKKNTDMAEELSNRTFFVTELARGKAAEKEYHSYFKKDGVLAIKFSPRHSKSGKWEVDDKGILCITTIRHKSNKTSFNITKCGKLVKSSARVYRWYDDKGRLRANFTLQGQGNKLP